MIEAFNIYKIQEPLSAATSHSLHNDNWPIERFSTHVEWMQEFYKRAVEHGDWASVPLMGSRYLTLEGDLLADSSDDYWTKRLSFMGMFDPVRTESRSDLGDLYLYLSNNREMIAYDFTIDGYPELPLEALSPQAGKYQVNFRIPSPYLYTPSQQNVSVSSPYSGAYRSYNKTFNKVYGTIPSNPGSATITNDGNARTDNIRIVLAGPITNPFFQISSDQSILCSQQINLTIPSGDSVTIDNRAKTVTYTSGNTSTNRNDAKWYDWLYAKPGANTITVTASEWPLAGSVTIYWHNAFLI